MSIEEKIAQGLQEFADALERGDISKFRRTKLVRQEDGTIKRIVVDGRVDGILQKPSTGH